MAHSPTVVNPRSGGRPYALVWSPIPLISWLMPFIGHTGACSSSGRTYDFAGPYTVNEDRLLFGQPTRYLPLIPAAAEEASLELPGDPAVAPSAASQGPNNAAGAALDDPEARLVPKTKAASAVADEASWLEGPAGRVGHKSNCATDGSGGSRLAPGQGPASAMAAAAAYSWDHRLTFAATTYRLLPYNLMTNNCHCFVAHFLNQLDYRGGRWDMVNLAALMFLQARYTSVGGWMRTWLPWAVLVAAGGYFGGLTFLLCYLGVCVPLLAWFLLYTWCCWRDLRF